MAAQEHQSDPRILGRRTLEQDHRVLAAILRPGMSVLDVGCGTGAITRGMARAVGPEGLVTGCDRDAGLLALAGQQPLPNLTFELADAAALAYEAVFDVVTASRTLQWIPEPGEVVRRMARAVRPGGWVVVLDYNHDENAWAPEPPASFRRFYSAFLAWRAAHGWDNRMAERLPDLFRSAGLEAVASQPQDEVCGRGEDGSLLWAEVIANLGGAMREAGAVSANELALADAEYRAWVASEMLQQRLSLAAVVGQRSSQT